MHQELLSLAEDVKRPAVLEGEPPKVLVVFGALPPETMSHFSPPLAANDARPWSLITIAVNFGKKWALPRI